MLYWLTVWFPFSAAHISGGIYHPRFHTVKECERVALSNNLMLHFNISDSQSSKQ